MLYNIFFGLAGMFAILGVKENIMDYTSIKQRLLLKCQEYAEQRIATITNAINHARESANSETKSSAGDKYETGRSMMQLEQAQNAKHLEEALKLKQALDQVKIEQTSDSVIPGSLVITTAGNFFVAISIGKVALDEEDYIVLAPVSPLGKDLFGKKIKQTGIFNKQEYTILAIY